MSTAKYLGFSYKANFEVFTLIRCQRQKVCRKFRERKIGICACVYLHKRVYSGQKATFEGLHIFAKILTLKLKFKILIFWVNNIHNFI